MTDIRAFVAIELDPAIGARLAALQAHLRAAESAVTWARPDGIHVTLKFLGNVSETLVPTIAETLAGVAQGSTPFTMTLAGAGGFPDLRNPRVVWAGISAGADELRALAQSVEERLAELGFPRENRPFHPHVTLGRVKRPSGLARLTSLVESYQGEEFGEMSVREIVLMRSDLSPSGARYTALCRVPLLGEERDSG